MREPLFTEHLTMPEHVALLRDTALGQAHIAGTGPEGKTCRECAKWFNVNRAGDRVDHMYTAPGEDLVEVRPALCHHPIANKAYRRVPHDAKACRFFKQEDEPPVARRPRLRGGPKLKVGDGKHD